MNSRQDPWLLTRLFDLSFSRFVALSLARIVYVVLMVAGLAGLIFLTVYLFQTGQREMMIAALLVLVLGPPLYFVYLLLIRLLCETLIVVFAMAEYLEQIRANIEQLAKREQSAPPS
jgi:hypothetical protein